MSWALHVGWVLEEGFSHAWMEEAGCQTGMSASLEVNSKEISTETIVKANERPCVYDEENGSLNANARESGKASVRVHGHGGVLAGAGGLVLQEEQRYPLGRMNETENVVMHGVQVSGNVSETETRSAKET